MNSIQNHPAYLGRNAYSKPIRELDIEKQLRVLVDALGQQHLVRQKSVSTKTASDRFIVALLVVRQLKEQGFLLRSCFGLGQRHISVLTKLWEGQHLSAATIQTRMSHLRWLAAAIGKAGMIRDPMYYGLAPETVARTYVAQQDKSWSARNVEFVAIFEKVGAIDPLVACQMRMQYEFGLRTREAILIRPAISHVGDSLRIEEGTKGGRSRVVQIRYDSQREALESAKDMAKSCRRGTLVPSGGTFEQAKNRFYYVARLAGVTKDQLGVTSHGLRHEYANDLYEDVAGQPTIVRGASQILNRAADRLARKAVTSDLGHVRLDIVGAYTGPVRPRPKSSSSDEGP